MTWLFLAIGLLWLIVSLTMCFHLRRIHPLPHSVSDLPAGDTVSVVIAARDEADRIQGTVQRLLDQMIQNSDSRIKQIIVVDDRSSDETPQILQRLAEAHPALCVVRVDHLPEGWLGKTHALHVGASHANGTWILFTDADVWISSGTIEQALSASERTRSDMVCLFPSTAAPSKRHWMGDGFVLTFGLTLVDVFSRVNADDPRGFAGVGAFNLIRKDVYQKIGGHEPLRLEIADDPMLGVLVRRSGGRIRAFLAADRIECDYASGPLSLIRRLEKNHFAILRFNTLLAFSATCVGAILWCTAFAGLFWGSPAGLFAGLSLFSIIVPGFFFAQKINSNPVSALVIPLGLPLLGISLLNSTVKTLWQGGVTWRDTFYSLKTLRHGCLNWWPRQWLTPIPHRDPPA
jgi:glycosyltransferase involved in cell wall biosynthesis